jgi:hypothetical protein
VEKEIIVTSLAASCLNVSNKNNNRAKVEKIDEFHRFKYTLSGSQI